MKKIILLFTAIVALMTSGNAQSFYRYSSNIEGFIPAEFTENNEILMVGLVSHWEFTDEGYDYLIYDSVKVIDKNLDIQKAFAVPDFGTRPGQVYINERMNYNHEYDTDWVDNYSEEAIRIKQMGYLDLNNMSEYECFLSQTLFNNDLRYEYVVPVYSSTPVASITYEGGTVYDNYYANSFYSDSAYRKTHIYYPIVRFDVYSDNGSVVTSINPPSGFSYFGSYSPLSFIRISNIRYLLTRLGDEDEEYVYAWYRFNQQSQSVECVGVRPFGVRPTVARSGEEIVVEFDDKSSATEIEVTNMLGQTMKRIPVKPGQREVRFNSAEVSKGVNVIHQNGKKGVKILVR